MSARSRLARPPRRPYLAPLKLPRDRDLEERFRDSEGRLYSLVRKGRLFEFYRMQGLIDSRDPSRIFDGLPLRFDKAYGAQLLRVQLPRRRRTRDGLGWEDPIAFPNPSRDGGSLSLIHTRSLMRVVVEYETVTALPHRRGLAHMLCRQFTLKKANL